MHRTLFFVVVVIPAASQCLKITEIVSFNIASEASYVYILSGQKLIKDDNTVNFGKIWKPEANGQTALPDMSVWIGQKLVEKAKIQKFKWDNFEWFSNNVQSKEMNLFLHHYIVNVICIACSNTKMYSMY